MKLIAVCSGKGGTGKSCVTAYTGAALAAMRKKTLLIDMDKAPGALDLIFGAQNSVVFNVRDVLRKQCEPQKAIIPVPGRENLFLLPAGDDVPEEKPAMSLDALIQDVKNDYDFIFVDGADLFMPDPKTVAAVLLVTTPDSLAVRAAARKSHELYESGVQNMRLIINNVPPRVIPIQGVKDFDDVIDRIGVQLIGVIPASQRLAFCANNGEPLQSETMTITVFTNIAARLRGRPEPLLIK